MKIGIMSDTHGSLTAFKKALEVLGSCDFILHAGDILYHGPRNPLPEGYNPRELAEAINRLEMPFVAASGNCDAPIDSMLISVPIQSPYALICLDKFRILVNHGHEKSEDELVDLAVKWHIDILVTGHTHVKRLEKRNRIILVNPGSCSLPKDGISSAAVMEGNEIRLVNIKDEIVVSRIVLA
ncbi:MAG: phosphodiesterase [Tepidanaerobacteraceae bacterium]|jgi:putative phosphoesterase|nr:phosphodiesterase [Tepidanaerobacteraceae bacterium]